MSFCEPTLTAERGHVILGSQGTKMGANASLAAFRTTLAIVAILACAAWTKVDGKPVDASTYAPTRVCIEENPEVKLPDLVSLIEEGFQRHGIATEVYDKIPDVCEFYVKYTATRRWDFVAFLSDARIAIYHQGKLIGFVERTGTRGVFGGGGASPDKWASTKSKIDPLMDRLLEGFPRR
ncbi:MAG: hypothetical protein JWR84_2750 [Caulobacter sp.]|nr:hypothetical protein [Caulobacter sp.]